MSDEFWKNRKKWDQIHGRGEPAHPSPAAPKPPTPRATLVMPEDKDAQIALLKQLLKDAWSTQLSAKIGNSTIAERTAEFDELDAKLREIGVLAPKKNP